MATSTATRTEIALARQADHRRAIRLLFRLVYSQSRPYRAVRRGVVALGLLLVVVMPIVTLISLPPDQFYEKDFVQPYLLGKAILNGAPLYVDINQLMRLYLGTKWAPVWPHPTPHPPSVGLLFVPISLLPYQTAVIVWLVLEIGFLAASLWLVLRVVDVRMGGRGLLVLLGFAMLWSPGFNELRYGQLMLLILLLTIGSWLALKRGQPLLSGILLGFSIAVKPVTWPVAFLYLLKGHRRGLLGLGASLAAILAVSSAIVGPSTWVDYVTHVLPEVGIAYRAYDANESLWSIGVRVFLGTGSWASPGITAPPLVTQPILANTLSVLLPAAALLFTTWLATRVDEMSAFALLTCVSILVSPIAWPFYRVLDIIPIAWIGSRLVAEGLPTKATNRALFVAALLLALDPLPFLAHVIGVPRAEWGDPTVPFAQSLLSIGPTVGTVVLLWLTAYVVTHLRSRVDERELVGVAAWASPYRGRALGGGRTRVAVHRVVARRTRGTRE